MDTRDIVEQLQDACDLATDKRELEWLCGNAKAEILRLRLALATLFQAANELHDEIDKQTYDEKRHIEGDIDDAYEFYVTVTAKQERDLSAAIILCEKTTANAIGHRPAACGRSGGPAGCASMDETESQ